MATYEEIYGKRVEVLDADPTLTSAYEGQVWYNSTTGALKSVVSFGAWRAGAVRSNVTTGGTSGTQTAGLVAHGYDYGPPDQSTNLSEEYNGYAWTSTPNCNTTRYQTNQSGTLTTTFYCDGTMHIKNYFDAWQKLIHNDLTGNFNFWDEYTAEFDVFTRTTIASGANLDTEKDKPGWADKVSQGIQEFTHELNEATGVDGPRGFGKVRVGTFSWQNTQG